MTKTLYRVGEGANLAAFPRGTKIGSVIPLTEAEAMYERDMGRITIISADGNISAAIDDPGHQLVIPGETRGHPVDGISGEPLNLTDEERAALPEIGNVVPGEPAVLGLSDKVDPYPAGEENDPVELKHRRKR